MYSAIVPLEKVLRKVIECPARATRSFAVHAETLRPENGRDDYVEQILLLKAIVSVFFIFVICFASFFVPVKKR